MKSEEKFQTLIENINDAIFSLDGQGRFTYLSPVIQQLMSYRVEEMIGQPIARFVYSDDLSEFLSCLRRSLVHQVESVEFRVQDKTGEVKHMRASIRPLMTEDRSPGLAGVLSDVTKSKSTEIEMRSSFFRDRLTGLYNRAYFEEEMKRLDTSRQVPLSIILGDVNGLKFVNDVFGHSAGDKLLLRIAVMLRESCRQEDVIARLGGDEFGIFLLKTDCQAAMNIVHRIKMVCRNSHSFPIRISIALGTVTKEDPSTDLHTAMKEAEDRMYRDKLMESKAVRTAMISSVRQILFERKDEPEEHTQRVKQLTTRFGHHAGLPSHALDELAALATLHDIGKIVIPEKISLKPDRLSREEWQVIWKHPEIGYRIAASCPELAVIAESILCHHEWWNGAGYPRGLKGEEIPLHSRILSIVDAYDVMTHDRAGRKAMVRKTALDEIRKGAGTQFDPRLVETFLKTLSETSEESHTRQSAAPLN